MCGIAEHGSSRADTAVASSQDIADALHDGALQELTGMSLKLAALASNPSLRPGELRTNLWELQGATQAVIDELLDIVRRLSGQTVETDDDESGLAARLRSLSQAFTRESRIPCLFSVTEEVSRLQAPRARVLSRAVRELLTNVRKHACASLVEIGGRRLDDGSVEISVRDDGIGPPEDASLTPPYQGGYGLWSIAQSLAEVGGSLEIEARDGFCARIVLPGRAALPS